MKVQELHIERAHLIKSAILGLLIVFIGYRIAKLVVYPSPYAWLLIASIPIVFLLYKNYIYGIYLIMFSVFFADWLFGRGYIPAQLTWLPEVVLILYFLKFLAEKRRLVRTPIDLPIIIFIIIGIASCLINSSSLVSIVLAFRLDLKFVLMFYLVASLGLYEKSSKRMINVLIVLLVIQIPVAWYKYTLYGQNEAAIGTYSHFGGALSTILPLFAISLFAGLYLYYDNRIRYLLFIIGYLIFPIFADKRGFLFFGSILLFFFFLNSQNTTRKKLVPIAAIMLVGLFASLFYVTTWRQAVDNPRFILDYTISYTQQRNLQGEAGGRISAIVDTYQDLRKEPIRFLIGRSPGTTIKSFFSNYSKKGSSMPVNIVYGFTHLVSTAIDYGYLGFMCYLILPLFLLFKWNKRYYLHSSERYWKAMSYGFSGMIFSSLIIGLFYWELFRLDLSAFLFWFFAAVLYSNSLREKNISSESDD